MNEAEIVKIIATAGPPIIAILGVYIKLEHRITRLETKMEFLINGNPGHSHGKHDNET